MERFERRHWVELENDNKQFFAVLHEPLLESKMPAVLICPGFGSNKIGPNRIYVKIAEELARAGIASLRVDYRGLGDSEGDFKDSSVHGQVDDALIAMQYLAKHPKVDPTRIGILGNSLGGAIAVYTASKYQNLKSMTLWASVANGVQWHQEWANFSATPTEGGYIEWDGELINGVFIREFLEIQADKELQKLDHVSLLHVHGEKDEVVMFSHSQDYRKNREANGSNEGQTKFVTLPNSDHSFTDLKEKAQLFDETVKWFQETL